MKEIKVISASWCQNCNTLKSQLDKLGVKYEVIDADVDFDLARKVGARSLPTSVLMVNKEVSKVFVGLKANEIAEAVKG